MSIGGGCNRGGSENFRKVIAGGEALLTTKNEAPTAAQVHFMVGDAYSDMVAIAGGVDPNGDYASDDLGNEADSRAKGLQHYRAGLGWRIRRRMQKTRGVRRGISRPVSCQVPGMRASATRP